MVNVAGSAIGLDGRIVARPRDGLVVYRIPAGARLRWIAVGLAPDGWTGTHFRYCAWHRGGGVYRLVLYTPTGTPPRKVTIGKRQLIVRAGTDTTVRVPTNGGPLDLRVDVPG